MPIPSLWNEILPPSPAGESAMSPRLRLWVALRRFVLWLPATAALIAAAAGLAVLADQRSDPPQPPTIHMTELPTTPTTRLRIDINTATQSELQTLPGIGASRAEAIVALRAIEPFRSLADLFDRGVLDHNDVAAIQNLAAVYVSPHD